MPDNEHLGNEEQPDRKDTPKEDSELELEPLVELEGPNQGDGIHTPMRIFDEGEQPDGLNDGQLTEAISSDDINHVVDKPKPSDSQVLDHGKHGPTHYTGDLTWSKGGKYLSEEERKKVGSVPHAIGKRDGVLSDNAEERNQTIFDSLKDIENESKTGQGEKKQTVDDRVRRMFDISNQRECIVDEDGFLKLPNRENDRVFQLVYKTSEKNKAKYHRLKKTGDNIVLLARVAGKIDFTPAYVDARAFKDLVDECGLEVAIQETIEDPNALNTRKVRIRNELRDKREGRKGYAKKEPSTLQIVSGFRQSQPMSVETTSKLEFILENRNKGIVIEIEKPPKNGSLTINDANEATYVPEESFVGPDEFTYTIAGNWDHSKKLSATVKIEVTPEQEVRRKGLHEDLIQMEMKQFLCEEQHLDPDSDYKENDLVVLKINLEGKSRVNDLWNSLRGGEKSVERVNHPYKTPRLYTTETVANRYVAVMRKFVAPKVHEFRSEIGKTKAERGREEKIGGRLETLKGEMSKLDPKGEEKKKLEKEKKKLEKELGDIRGRRNLEELVEKGAVAIAEVMRFMHRLGIKHRDEKPDNVFVKDDGYACVADWSIAKPSDEISREVTAGWVLGSPAYMSPAQARGENTNERDDIYSMGITLKGMITKRDPYEGTQEQVRMLVQNYTKSHALTHPNHTNVLYEDLGSKWNPLNWKARYRRGKFLGRLEKVLAWCCQVDRDKRPESCDSIIEDFQSTLRGEEPNNVNEYMKARSINEKELIRGAFQTGKELISEDAELARDATHNLYLKYVIPATIVGSILLWEGAKFTYKTVREIYRAVNGQVQKEVPLQK